MPKILPALGVVAIIAFSIGFNTLRFPIVWEMVGPSAHLPEDTNIAERAAGSESAPASQSAQPAEPIASAPRENTVLTSSADVPGGLLVSTENTLPGTQAFQAQAGLAESARQTAKLVPVPSNLFIGNGTPPPEQYRVERLPPVYQSVAIPAGRYAAEYPQSPIPIYPSTGL